MIFLYFEFSKYAPSALTIDVYNILIAHTSAEVLRVRVLVTQDLYNAKLTSNESALTIEVYNILIAHTSAEVLRGYW